MTLSDKMRAFFKSPRFFAHSTGEDGRHPTDRPGLKSLICGAVTTGVIAATLLTASTQPAAAQEQVSPAGIESAATWYETEYLTHLEAIKAHPQFTEHDKYIAGLHSHFENALPFMKTIILPRDMINRSVWHHASANGLTRGEMTKAYVQDRAWDIDMPRNIAEQFEEALADRDPKTWRIIANNFSLAQSQGTHVACVVAPSSPNTSAVDDVAKMMGVLGSSIVAVGDKPGQIDVSKDEIRRFLDYGAIAQCFDMKWTPMLMGQLGLTGQHHRHLIASFRDSAAALMMAQQGYRDTAGKMAQVRAVGSGIWGPYAVYGRNGIHNPENLHGSIYATHPVLHAAQAFIDSKTPQELAQMDFKTLIGTALVLTERHALTQDQFELLHMAYQNHNRALRLADGGLTSDRGKKDARLAADRRAWLQGFLGGIGQEIERSLRRSKDVPYKWTQKRLDELREEIGVNAGWLPLLEVMGRDAGATWSAQERAITYFQDQERAKLYKQNEFASRESHTLDSLDENALTHRYRRFPRPAPDFTNPDDPFAPKKK